MIRRLDMAPEDIDPREGDVSIAEPSLRDTSAADAWLGVFARLLHLPEPQRQAIRAELEAHIHERTRDLMLDGCDERSATRQAIEELGEIAQLARRFDAADQPRTRRTLMHLAIISVIATASVTGVLMLNSSRHSAPMRVFEQQAAELQPPAEIEAVAFEIQSDMTLETLVELIMQNSKVNISVDWDKMEEIGLARDTPLGIQARKMPAIAALRLLAARSTGRIDELAWRFRDGTLVLASAEEFDRKESVLTCYEVGSVVGQVAAHGDVPRGEAADQLINLITQFVEPESWVDNGGSLAKLTIVGAKMFVEAPPRIQERIQWIVSELASETDAEPEARAASDRATGMLVDKFGRPLQVNAPDDCGAVPMLGDIPLLHHLYREPAALRVPGCTGR